MPPDLRGYVFRRDPQPAVTVENRVDRVQLYGSVELTRDKAGLERARQLKELVDKVLLALEPEDLPDVVAVDEPDTVANPFA